MNPPLIHCPKCKAALLHHAFNRDVFQPCPACAVPLAIEVFPAMFRPVESGRTGEAVMMEGEASCFDHPAKKAVIPCEGCGRFLCALCDCEHQGQHLCPTCLESGRKKGKIKSLENKRIRYDSMAMALTLYPLIIAYFTLITAPVALYIVIRHWKSQRGLTQRSRAKLIIAGIIALLEIAGWALIFIGIFAR